MSGKYNGRTVSWQAADEKVLKRALAEALSLLKESDGQVTHSNPLRFEIVTTVLAHYFKLGQSFHLDETRGIITHALFTLASLKQREIAELADLIEQEAAGRRSIPLQPFHIVIPLDIDSSKLDGRRSIVILGNQLRFTTWKQVRRTVDFREWQRVVNIYHAWPDELQSRYTPVTMTLRARSGISAFELGEQSYECLRALLNVAVNYGRHTWRSGNRPKALADVHPFPIAAAFDKSGAYESFFYTPNIVDRGQSDLRPGALRRVRSILAALKDDPRAESTTALLRDAIIGYGRALDQAATSDAFLFLWQVLERVTYPSQDKYSMDDVCRRARILMKSEPFLEDALPAFAGIRNQLVHSGKFHESGDQDVRLMKLITEFCIIRLLGLRRKIGTISDLTMFYQQSIAARGDTKYVDRLDRILKHVQEDSA